ncbi:MAG: hypothetical protein KJ050_08640 [Candidatus Omnitrophica bacterium]|nr:hypothetical protein [bacterium]MCL4734990.1 hypothetical protein [Candidatus Omnitrophota bacterium]NUP92826.1 hypothetical protein [Candidatus Omnitrophota bacterium]
MPEKGTPGLFLKGVAAIGLLLSIQLVLVAVIHARGEKVLFDRLDSDKMADVVDFLKSKGMNYRLTDEGTVISIRGEADEVRKEFQEWQEHRQNLYSQQTKKVVELTGSSNPDPHRLNAIRKELEKLLSKGCDHIEWARVGFRQRDRLALEGGEGKKGAAVIVGTGGAVLPDIDVERIQWVVANSFAGLKPSDVLVLNEDGRELTRSSPLEN